MKNIYKIAGLKVYMDSFGRTKNQAIPYLIEHSGEADIKICADWSYWKANSKTISDDSCEYLASGDSFYRQLIMHNGMMIHSSAIIMDGKAYLFSAPCGTGKSTHVSLWRNVFGDERVRVLNDDKPALRLEDGIWYAYGTPWSGKTGQNLNLKVPLAGIAIIGRGEKNTIEKASASEAIHEILGQTSRTKTAAEKLKQLELLDKLITNIPIWKLRCNMEPEAAIVAYEAMSGEKWRK